MNAPSVETLVRQAETLPIEDQLLLMARLAETVRQQWRPSAVRRKWHEIRGIVQSPMMGEDAQAWVSRTRQEAISSANNCLFWMNSLFEQHRL